MDETQKRKELEEQKDVLEAIEKIKKLQEQIDCPKRDGMISALKDAKDKAPAEILALEIVQGSTHWKPFEYFSDEELLWKLSQYQQGLVNYCVEKIGKHLFDKLMSRETEV